MSNKTSYSTSVTISDAVNAKLDNWLAQWPIDVPKKRVVERAVLEYIERNPTYDAVLEVAKTIKEAWTPEDK